MKSKTILLTCLAIAALTGSCDKPNATSQQLDKVEAKAAAAAKEVQEQDYTYAQKSEFTEKLRTQLTEINRDLDELAAKIEKSSDAVKAEAKPKLESLRQQTAGLNKHLDEAKNATETTWDSVKATSKLAFNDLKEGFQKARQWVSDKIAP